MAWKICLFILLAVSCWHGRVLTSSTFETIQKSIRQLEADFKANMSDVAKGEAVFTNMLISNLWSQTSDRRILIAQIISKYLEMLNNLTNSTNTPKHVVDLKEALEVYKIDYSDSLKRASDLIQLAKLPMSDYKIQRKAASEMYSVLQQVKIEENKRKRRRRRQNPRNQKRHIPSFIG
ncbi:interferon gamma-like [Sceloporus undulatus]|uniref:interferon gamma-like n=1 Tax=Sceloporus undulatus TaxID=8520 RepID=UPI001C4DCF20|nr:interferon gamma-like [Sceloporus undulatus]